MDRHYKLVIEFNDPYALLDFADASIPLDAEVVKADGLDFPHGGDSRTFLVRKRGERPVECTLAHTLGLVPEKAHSNA